MDNLKKAFSEALNLAVGASYIEKDTVDIIIRKAYLNAKALENKVGSLETKEEIEEEKPVAKNEEIKEPVKKEQENKKTANEAPLKEELKNVKEIVEAKEVKFTKSDQQMAADILKDLTDKKIRGEI